MTDVQATEMINQVAKAFESFSPEVQQNLAMTMGTILGALLVYALAWTIIGCVALWKLFKKAGQPGWKIFIPIYNLVTLYKISGISPWWVLVLMIASGVSTIPNAIAVTFALLVAIAINVYQCYKLSKSFGKGIGYTLGLLVFNSIFYLILGLGDAKYTRESDKK